MRPELILQSDILDIIFENRNKDYGAYDLRKEYNKRIKKSMTIVFITTSAVILLSFYKFNDKSSSNSQWIFPTDTIVLQPAPVVDPPPPDLPKENPQAQVKHNVPIITKDENVHDTLPTLEQLAVKVISNTDVDGVLAPNDNDVAPANSSPKGNESPQPAQPEQPEVLTTAQFMPEFPGGQSAFSRFLSRHLRVPEEHMQPGQKVRVVVKFVVGAQGDLTQIEFPDEPNMVFRQEVMRVMKKMPRWKPGMQNGRAVAVYFHIPVIFHMSDEE